MKDTLPDRVRLGAFTVDLRAGELRAGLRTIRLQEQPFKVLQMLIEMDGEIVTRDQIQDTLWPNDTVVEFDHSINAAIKKLRQALGDSADTPKYVETVARRGYRLLVRVEREPMVAEPPQAPANPAPAAPQPEIQRRIEDIADPPRRRASDAISPAAQESSNGNRTGKKVSHYRVLEVIGGGSMGMVYKAEDLKLGRQVALKFLPDEMAWDAVALKRFEREAKASSVLDHPNICTVYEVEDCDGQPFIVMQLLQGETLRDRLATLACKHATLPLDELLEIAIQICQGLQAAHDKGVMHRDIKPANIFLTCSGQVKILDFGLAKLFSAVKEFGSDTMFETEAASAAASHGAGPATTGGSSPRLGVALGTAGYMSPEQIRGEKLDARTDIFSFGLVLYEMATAQRAFSGDTAATVQSEILNATPPPIQPVNPAIPPRLEAIINKALEKDRDRRYQSVAEVRADLDGLRTNAAPPVHESPRRLRRVALALILVLVFAGAAVAYWWWHKAPTRSAIQDPTGEFVLLSTANYGVISNTTSSS